MKHSFAYLTVCTALSVFTFTPSLYAAEFVSHNGDLIPLPSKKPAEIIVKHASYMASRPVAATFANGKTVHSEDLLEANGKWSVVEKGGYDPEAAHMQARKSVNIKRRSKDSSLSAHFEPDAKSGEDGKVRLLEVEGAQKTDWAEIYSSMKPALKSQTPKKDVTPKDTAPKPAADIVVTPQLEKAPTVAATVQAGAQEGAQPGVQNKPGSDLVIDQKAKMIDGIIVPGTKPRQEGTGRYMISAEETIAIRPKAKPELKPSTQTDKETVRVKQEEAAQQDKASVAQSLVSVTSAEPLPAIVKLDGVDVPIPKTKPHFAVRAATAKGQSGVSAVQPRVFEVGRVSDVLSEVLKIRSGVYQGKTRIVIELTENPHYKTMVDPLRNVLRVKIMNSKWGASMQGTLSVGEVLGTYVVREQRDGSTLMEVRLKKPVDIMNAMILGPNTVSQHRIVIDLTQ